MGGKPERRWGKASQVKPCLEMVRAAAGTLRRGYRLVGPAYQKCLNFVAKRRSIASLCRR